MELARSTSGSPREALDRVGRALQQQLETPLGRQQPPQAAGRVVGDHLAVVHDRDPVAQAVGLEHVVRRQQERRPQLPQLDDPLPEEQPRLRVEPRRRLVEHEQLRLVHQRPGDHQPLGHPARVLVDLVGLPPAQAEPVEQLERPLAPVPPRRAEVGSVEGQVLERRQRPVEVAHLRDDGDPLLDGHRVLADVDPIDEDSTRRRLDPRRHRPDRRRLSRPVRPEQAEDLAPGDYEVDAADGLRPVGRVALAETLDADHLSGPVPVAGLRHAT